MFLTTTYRIIICWFSHSFIYLFVFFSLFIYSLFFTYLLLKFSKKIQHVVLKKQRSTCCQSEKLAGKLSRLEVVSRFLCHKMTRRKPVPRWQRKIRNGFQWRILGSEKAVGEVFVGDFFGIYGEVIKITFCEGDQMGVSKNRVPQNGWLR